MRDDKRGRAVAPDLGLLFTTNAPDVTADRIFINRDRERLTFDEAVRVHYDYIASPTFDSQDVLTPRRNVQVFYGTGGVGKTSLSRALERRHGGKAGGDPPDWPKMERAFKTSIEARIDLASEGGLDLERTLLLIRAAVANLGKPMHAFDLALSRYWEQAHPDRALADFLRADGLLSRLSDAIKLPSQIERGLAEIGSAMGSSSTLVSTATQLVKTLVGGQSDQRSKRHAIEGCRRLLPLLQAEQDVESLSYYPHLLAWDLAELARRFRGGFHVVVFMDTIEDVARGTHRNFERLIQRLVWLMPNVLFVISGRNRLDWADAGDGGRNNLGSWPGLADDASPEAAQHLVGRLSQPDCAKFLALRLRSHDEPFIPEDIRTRIAQESQGYPLYLDLAVTRFMQIVGSGAIPAPTDFEGGFPGLISRVLRDLDADERRLVRILSLMDSFDIELAVKIADLPTESVATRLAQRTYVDIDDRAPLPYSIHRLIRTEIQLARDDPDAFSAADWARYAHRAFDYLGERYYRAHRVGERAIANSVLNQALRLADQYHLELGWCTDAAFLFIEDSLWESSVRPLTGSTVATPAAALAQTLLAVVNQRMEERRGDRTHTRGEMMGTDLRETARALTEVLATDILTGEARDLATYYAAEALRELGRGAEAEVLIRSISGSDSRVAGLAAKGLVHRLRRLGRFRELRELIDAQPREAVWLQMAGTLYWSQGRLTQAIDEYKASRELFLEAGYLGNADELLGCLAFVCGLAGNGEENVAFVGEGIATLRTSRNRWATLMAELGAVLLVADGGEVVAARILAISEQGQAAGLTSIQAYAHFSNCLNAAISESPQALHDAKTALRAHITPEDFSWLLEIVDFWSDEQEPSNERQTRADWLDGEPEARARWRQVLLNRRSRPPATLP